MLAITAREAIWTPLVFFRLSFLDFLSDYSISGCPGTVTIFILMYLFTLLKFLTRKVSENHEWGDITVCYNGDHGVDFRRDNVYPRGCYFHNVLSNNKAIVGGSFIDRKT